MHKGFLEDPILSYKAKGILAYLLTKPDDWEVRVSDLINHARDGRDSVYAGLKELSECGYYRKVQLRDVAGRLSHWDCTVCEVPMSLCQDMSNEGNEIMLGVGDEIDEVADLGELDVGTSERSADYPYTENTYADVSCAPLLDELHTDNSHTQKLLNFPRIEQRAKMSDPTECADISLVESTHNNTVPSNITFDTAAYGFSVSGKTEYGKAVPISNNNSTKNYKPSNTNQFSSSPVLSIRQQRGQDNGQTEDIISKIASYRLLVHENIGYNDFKITRPHDLQLIDEFVSIIIDVIFSEGKTLRVGSEDKLRELVKSQLLKLGHWDINHVLDQFKNVTERIVKKKQYILTMLYNCKMEMDSYYRNAVAADMWQRVGG